MLLICFLCPFALHARFHELHLIKFHLIYPASRRTLPGPLEEAQWDEGGGGRFISKRKRPLVGSWKAYNCFSQTEKRNKRQKGKRRSDKEIKREKERN